MKKIPTIFQRDWNGNRTLVTPEPNPDCDWVFRGEGQATRKYDGTSCLVKDGQLFKRYELKPGKTPPEGFIAAQEVDEETGKQPGWVPVGNGTEDQYHRQAFAFENYADGTYELIGPKIQGGAEGEYSIHLLLPHGCYDAEMPTEDKDIPRDFDGLKAFLSSHRIEGIVWHHTDGRMGKIKARDFGIKWPR